MAFRPSYENSLLLYIGHSVNLDPTVSITWSTLDTSSQILRIFGHSEKGSPLHASLKIPKPGVFCTVLTPVSYTHLTLPTILLV